MDVNPFVFNYFTGAAQGFNPFIGYNPSSNFSGGSIFNFNNMYSQNPYPMNFTGYNTNIYTNSNPNYFSYTGPYINIFKLGNTGSETQPATTVNTTQKETAAETKKETKKDTKDKESLKHSNYIGENLAKNASKYLGYNESDGTSKKFSDSPEWCADFVTYIVKETYQNKGLEVPQGFGNHRVENLKQWGIDNGKYFSIADKNNRGKLITDNVNIGDILILRENNASHTGIVSKINSDGSFETIEGNRSDAVRIGRYNPDHNEISGFVQLTG